MRSAWLIASRDFRAYFSSPIAYTVIAIFLARIGYYFFDCLAFFIQSQQEFMRVNSGPKPTISQAILANLFMHLQVMLIIFFIPFITMRLFAEEKRDHTDTLLLSAPIDIGSVIWGKFFAALGFVLVMLSGTLFYALVLVLGSNVDLGVMFTCYLGTILGAIAAISIGLFWSATTENQIVAAAMTIGSLLTLWMIAMSSFRAGPVWADVLRYISISDHLQGFLMGTVDSSDLLYFGLVTALGLFGTFVAFDANSRG